MVLRRPPRCSLCAACSKTADFQSRRPSYANEEVGQSPLKLSNAANSLRLAEKTEVARVVKQEGGDVLAEKEHTVQEIDIDAMRRDGGYGRKREGDAYGWAVLVGCRLRFTVF